MRGTLRGDTEAVGTVRGTLTGDTKAVGTLRLEVQACRWGAGAVRMGCCAYWVKWQTGRRAPGQAVERPTQAMPVCSQLLRRSSCAAALQSSCTLLS